MVEACREEGYLPVVGGAASYEGEASAALFVYSLIGSLAHTLRRG
jgi:hypothetical protein